MPAKIAAAKTTAVKKTAAKAIGPKAVADKKVAGPAKGEGAGDSAVSVALRLKDLVDRVTDAGDFKKKDVRDIVEVTLAELGRALEAGQTLNLPPFGKLRVGRSRELANGSMMTLKLRRVPAKSGNKNAQVEGLADAGEAS